MSIITRRSSPGSCCRALSQRRGRRCMAAGRPPCCASSADRFIWTAMSDAPPPEPALPARPPEAALPDADPQARWKFLRDVAVFEFKLALNNVHNFFQIPLTLGAALIDLVFKGKSEGERFYKLVESGRTIDDAIDIYSVIAHREKSLNRDYTVDAVIDGAAAFH